MTRFHWSLHGCLAGLLAVTAVAVAQPTPGAGSPLKQGFEAAWARQPEQRAAELRRDAARAGLRAAERWTPEAAALELNSKTDRFTRNNGAREYEATVAVPLWLPGERTRAQATAQAESVSLDARLQAGRWRVAGEVREAYWVHQRARIERDLAAQRLSNAQQLAADVARRVKAGDLARADSHQAEAAVAAAEAAIADADVVLSQAAQQLITLTGGVPTLDAETAPETPPPSVAVDSRHPLLNELVAQVALARRQRDLVSQQNRPNPELTFGAARERGDFGERYGQSVILGVRIPLGTHASYPSKVATAGAELLEAETQLAIEQERVQAQARAAAARVDALRTALAAAHRRARLAAESRGFFEKSFRLGESDLPTRLRVELEAVEAERQAARSRIELAAAISTLHQALGLLPQ